MIPLVSIAIITYNQEEFIEETIESCLNQTYKNIELVIGDDASDDKTVEILLKYKKKYPQKINLILNEKNVGITNNYNKVLSECKGKYICMLGGDDRFLPTKIEKQIKFLEANPHLIFCFHDIRVFEDKTEKTLYFLPNKNKIKNKILDTDLLVQEGTYFGACSVCHKNLSIYCNKDIKIASDWLNWIELSYHGEYGYIEEVLSEYRKHDNNITKISQARLETVYQELKLTLNKVQRAKLKNISSLKNGKNRIELHMVGAYIGQQNIDKVLEHLNNIKIDILFNYKKILALKILGLKFILKSPLRNIFIKTISKKFK